MNYFELYGLPLKFHVDEKEVKRKYYELSKRFHPDFHINDTPEKQQEILERSTQNNKALKTLSDPLKRIEYILQLNNLMAEGDKYQLPQDFLVDMMDVNETLMEQEFEPDAAVMETISKQVDDIEKALFDKLKVLTTAFDEQPEKDHEQALLQIKDLWYRQRYLLRIRDSLNKFATR